MVNACYRGCAKKHDMDINLVFSPYLVNRQADRLSNSADVARLGPIGCQRSDRQHPGTLPTQPFSHRHAVLVSKDADTSEGRAPASALSLKSRTPCEG